MVAKFRELGGKRDVDIAYFDTMLALWSLNVPENKFWGLILQYSLYLATTIHADGSGNWNNFLILPPNFLNLATLPHDVIIWPKMTFPWVTYAKLHRGHQQ